jgi:hypothetical protein
VYIFCEVFLYSSVLGSVSLNKPLKRMCGYLSLEVPPHKAGRAQNVQALKLHMPIVSC